MSGTEETDLNKLSLMIRNRFRKILLVLPVVLICTACHDPHSNDARNSCASCHPAISNCKLDVATMNTSYADPKSKNNIHFVSCADCHQEIIRKITTIGKLKVKKEV